MIFIIPIHNDRWLGSSEYQLIKFILQLKERWEHQRQYKLAQIFSSAATPISYRLFVKMPVKEYIRIFDLQIQTVA